MTAQGGCAPRRLGPESGEKPMGRRLFAFAHFVLLAGLGAVPAFPAEPPAPGAGTVSGVVRFESEYPTAERLRVTADNAVCGTHKKGETFLVSPENKGLKNVLVTVEGVAGGRTATPTEAISIEQAGCAYVPHFQVAQLGAQGLALTLTNKDATLHNIHAYNQKGETLFNVGQPGAGRSLAKTLSEPGVIAVRCDVHAWMRAWIVVLKGQPYYAVTDETGHFSIAGVPPGTYLLRAWHEALGEMKKPVVVGSDGAPDADFVIKPKGK